MTLQKWGESVRLAKIKLGYKPDEYSVIEGKLLKEAQSIYHVLLMNDKLKPL